MIRASLFAFALLAAGCTPPAADTTPPAEPAAVEAPVAAAPATPADFSELAVGMEKADLLKKSGKPSMWTCG